MTLSVHLTQSTVSGISAAPNERDVAIPASQLSTAHGCCRRRHGNRGFRCRAAAASLIAGYY